MYRKNAGRDRKATPPVSPLRRALAESRLREIDVAEALGVDPKRCNAGLPGDCPNPATAGDWPTSSIDTNTTYGRNWPEP